MLGLEGSGRPAPDVEAREVSPKLDLDIAVTNAYLVLDFVWVNLLGADDTSLSRPVPGGAGIRTPRSSRLRTERRSAPPRSSSSELPEMPQYGFKQRRLTAMMERDFLSNCLLSCESAI